MRRAKLGDVAAFEQIVDRYKGQVYGLCYSLVRSREDAEEAAQDAFLKLFRSREQFEEGRPLEPWLLRIAGNVSRDVLRRRKSSRLPRAGASEVLLNLLEDPRSCREDRHAATRQAVR